MIDFRYHVVSLISVFLALAVGIVLGAGPLQGQIGTGLQKSVEALRAQKDDLHSELALTQKDVQQREAFLKAVSPAMTVGALGGRTVVIVALPGVDSSAVASTVQALETAGATVTARITIEDAWTAPDQEDRRASALLKVAAVDAEVARASGQAEAELALCLARSLMTGTGLAGAGLNGSVLRREALSAIDILKTARLINVAGTLRQSAYGAVILAPEVSKDSGSQPSPSVSALRQARLQAWYRLVLDLDSRGGGSVVLGPASAAGDGGLVQLIRADPVTKARVSTVDEGPTAMGEISTVLALQEQFIGKAEAYGFADSAQAPVPGATS